MPYARLVAAVTAARVHVRGYRYSVHTMNMYGVSFGRNMCLVSCLGRDHAIEGEHNCEDVLYQAQVQ